MGLKVVGEVTQRRKAPRTGTILGEGKLRELAAYTGGKGIVERYGTKSRSVLFFQ